MVMSTSTSPNNSVSRAPAGLGFGKSLSPVLETALISPSVSRMVSEDMEYCDLLSQTALPSSSPPKLPNSQLSKPEMKQETALSPFPNMPSPAVSPTLLAEVRVAYTPSSTPEALLNSERLPQLPHSPGTNIKPLLSKAFTSNIWKECRTELDNGRIPDVPLTLSEGIQLAEEELKSP